jgi:hypothetical protein
MKLFPLAKRIERFSIMVVFYLEFSNGEKNNLLLTAFYPSPFVDFKNRDLSGKQPSSPKCHLPAKVLYPF